MEFSSKRTISTLGGMINQPAHLLSIKAHVNTCMLKYIRQQQKTNHELHAHDQSSPGWDCSFAGAAHGGGQSHLIEVFNRR